jgi:hypothetical protein
MALAFQNLVFLEGGETSRPKLKIQSLTSPSVKTFLERDLTSKAQSR